MSEHRDQESAKEGSFDWAMDKWFLGAVCIVGLLLVGSAVYISIEEGQPTYTVVKTAIAFLTFWAVGIFAVIVLISGIGLLIAAVQRSYARGFVGTIFRPVAKALRLVGLILGGLVAGIAKLIGGLLGIALMVAVLAGIAGLLLFGIRQLF